MGKVFTYTIAGLMAVLLLFMLSLALGSVSIPIQDIIAILLGKGEGVANPSYSYNGKNWLIQPVLPIFHRVLRVLLRLLLFLLPVPGI